MPFVLARRNTLDFSIPIDYLVVAGGGGGGSADNQFQAGGGGGAGGLLSGSLTMKSYDTFTVTVGAGGTATGGNSNPQRGGNGGLSQFGPVTPTGGGGGAAGGGTTAGRNGGSGGGATRSDLTVGLGIPGQGFNGNVASGSDGRNGGAGGGAGGPGTNSGGTTDATNINFGGVGVTSSGIFEYGSFTYARGGDGGVNITRGGTVGGINSGEGGQGGFGANEAAGTASQFMRPGGVGGSGIVLIRYPRNFPTLQVSVGLIFSIRDYINFRVYRFTSGSGTVTF